MLSPAAEVQWRAGRRGNAPLPWKPTPGPLRHRAAAAAEPAWRRHPPAQHRHCHIREEPDGGRRLAVSGSAPAGLLRWLLLLRAPGAPVVPARFRAGRSALAERVRCPSGPHVAFALPAQMRGQRGTGRRLCGCGGLASLGASLLVGADRELRGEAFLPPLPASLIELLLRRCQLWGDSDCRGLNAHDARWQRKSDANSHQAKEELTPPSHRSPVPLTGLNGCAMLLAQLVSCRGAQKPHPHSRGSDDSVGGTASVTAVYLGQGQAVTRLAFFLGCGRPRGVEGGREGDATQSAAHP